MIEAVVGHTTARMYMRISSRRLFRFLLKSALRVALVGELAHVLAAGFLVGGAFPSLLAEKDCGGFLVVILFRS